MNLSFKRNIKTLFKNLGILPFTLYWKSRFFPSPARQREIRAFKQRSSFYRQFIKPGDVVFDIGANIGNRTEIFLDIGARVVAVEPLGDCVQILKLKFGRSAEIVQTAVGASVGTATMYLSDSSVVSTLSKDWIDTLSQTRFRDKKWVDTAEVPVTTLDELIARFGSPSFCKIDVEGFEPEVLNGLSTPIQCLSLEYAVPEKFENITLCLNLLRKLGEYEFNFTVEEKMELEMRSWVDEDTLISKLRIISSHQMFGDIFARRKTG